MGYLTTGILFLFLSLSGFSESIKGQIGMLLKQNRLDEGVTLCRQVELLASHDQNTAFGCAWVYFRKEMGSHAQKIMERFRKVSHIADYQLLVAYDYISLKQYDRAKVVLDQVRRENPGKPAAALAEQLSAELYEIKDPKGGLDTAAFIYRQLINNPHTDKGRISWGLGRYYQAKGDTRRAMQYYEDTARLWPKHAESRRNLGMIYLSQSGAQAAQKAAKWLSDAYKLSPNDSGVLEQLGVLAEKRGLKSEAVKKWQLALDLNKDAPIAKEKLKEYFGEVLDALIDAGKYELALKKMESAPKAVISEPKYHLKAALIYRGLNEYENAVGALQDYISTNPKDPKALRELGICYANLNLIDQSITFFSKAIQEEPREGINYAWLAWSLEGRGEWLKARDTWRRAIDLLRDPKELERATRKLSSIEKKIRERESERRK